MYGTSCLHQMYEESKVENLSVIVLKKRDGSRVWSNRKRDTEDIIFLLKCFGCGTKVERESRRQFIYTRWQS